jgi:hypothetical protein
VSKLIYIAGPYTASTEAEVITNVRLAEIAGQEILEKGFLPIIPHKITSHWDTWGRLTHWTHEEWIYQFCKPLLLRCDCLLLIEGWTDSKGAKLEHSIAIDAHIPIAYKIHEVPLLMSEGLQWK